MNLTVSCPVLNEEQRLGAELAEREALVERQHDLQETVADRSEAAAVDERTAARDVPEVERAARRANHP